MFSQAEYKRYTTNEIKPCGWLKRQLEIQAEGLSGNLYKIWPDIRDSSYIGGEINSWERVPYWLDGFVPLAYLLEDEEKIAVARRYIDGILASQGEDGWLCLCEPGERGRYDIWPALLILKVLTVYQECSGDGRIEEAVYNGLKAVKYHVQNFGIYGWSSSRWYECLIPAYWLYERRPEDWILELCFSLYAAGTNYKALLTTGFYNTPKNEWNHETHVVNIAMAIKSEALYARISELGDKSFPKKMLAFLDRYHGTVTGHFTGDECLSGSSPIQGAELCSIVEAMYSYEVLFEVTGDPYWCDRLEKLAYNALPATISEDMWTHQYDQQVNQIACVNMGEHTIFRTNNGESNMFGLEPNFGCCTANFNQGWPKFALSTFYHRDNTIVSAALAPSRVRTVIDGAKVEVELKTDYPFDNRLTYIVKADKNVDFRLAIRIPACISGFRTDVIQREENGFILIEKQWEGEDEIHVEFQFKTEFVERDGMYALERGPLVYALELEEDWQRREYVRNGVERKYPYCDYEIFPKSKWNYAFADKDIKVTEKGVGDIPFSKNDPPITITANMAEIPWEYQEGYQYVCSEKPLDTRPISGVVKKRFKPYGCSTLRMTEMPFAADSNETKVGEKNE